MAKDKKIPVSEQIEMTLEEAKAYRASLYKPQPKVLNEVQKREAFRIWWISQKRKYGKSRNIEKALWLHLKSIEMDSPENFEKGIFNFGLKKVK